MYALDTTRVAQDLTVLTDDQVEQLTDLGLEAKALAHFRICGDGGV